MELEASLRPMVLLSLALLTLAPPARAAVPTRDVGPPVDLAELRRDDVAAEAALAASDLDGAMKYFDYFGHEQEDFARATLEYRLARQKLGDVVREKFGRRAWGRTARALGVPRHGRGPGEFSRSVRREGSVVYVKNSGAGNEVPYVNAGGAWKVSVREVLVTALRARFGKALVFEEADLYVLAGKMAGVMRGRAGQLAALTDDVRAGRLTSTEQLQAAAEQIRRGAPATQPQEPRP